MRNMRAIVAVLVTLSVGTSVLAQYPNGHVWRFRDDYGVGSIPGANITTGNPQSDAMGLTPWSYEWVPEGANLASGSPWFNGVATLMTWDSAYAGGTPRWSKADNIGATIVFGYIEQITVSAGDRSAPFLRWTNPTSHAVIVDLQDTLTLHWWLGTTTQIDVAMTKFSSGGGLQAILYSNSRSRPAVGETENLPVEVLSVTLGVGESLTLSHRARSVGNCCVGMSSSLAITLTAGGDCPVDADGNRQITFADITAILSNFGAVCP